MTIELHERIINIINAIHADVQASCSDEEFEDVMVQAVLDRLSAEDAAKVNREFITERI